MKLVGQKLILSAAIVTLIVPIGVDGFFMAKARMENPYWLSLTSALGASGYFLSAKQIKEREIVK